MTNEHIADLTRQSIYQREYEGWLLRDLPAAEARTRAEAYAEAAYQRALAALDADDALCPHAPCHHFMEPAMAGCGCNPALARAA